MGASLARTLDPGVYYVSVDGVGNGTWTAGYDDYGSMGAYTLASTGCGGLAPIATLTDLAASATGRSVTLAASPTTSLGSLVGDVVFREGTTVVGTTTLGVLSPTLTLTSVPPGAHTYTATFVPLGLTHLGSVSPRRSVTVQVGSTTGLTATASGRTVTLDVQATTDGGAPAGTVELRDAGALVGTRDLVAGAASLTLASVTPGDHAYQARFVPSDPASYAGSSSPVRTLTIAADPVPPRPHVDAHRGARPDPDDRTRPGRRLGQHDHPHGAEEGEGRLATDDHRHSQARHGRRRRHRRRHGRHEVEDRDPGPGRPSSGCRS